MQSISARAKDLTRPTGATLLEAICALAVLAILITAVGGAVFEGIRVRERIREDVSLKIVAQQIIDSVVTQPFGDLSDPNPTTTQLNEIFDLDADPGTATLHQLSRWPTTAGGWEFQLAASPIPGLWRVQIDQDLDDDGTVATSTTITSPTTSSEVAEFLEVQQTLFRVRAFFDDNLILARTVGEGSASVGL